jgi:hypothetical protein
MYDFFTTLNELLGLLGFLLRAVGFGIIGYALGKFVLEAYQKANWQLQIALTLGFFSLLIGLTHFSSPGSAGAFALGAGLAFFALKKNEEKTIS